MTIMDVAIASGILKVAGNKLVSLLASEFVAVTGVKKDLLELQDIHGEIASSLNTVRYLSVENDARFRWVIKLKAVAYAVDDLLYEFHLEAEKNAIAQGLHAKPMSFLYRYRVAQKIKAIQLSLAAIAKQRRDMNAIWHNIPQSEQIQSITQTMLTDVEESQIPTRDQEKVSIVNKLLESNEGENDWIVSVVGLGGSGKTTLAQHVCHDNKIKDEFKDKIYWVHVSQEFDVQKLISKLFQAITKQKSDLHAPQLMVDEISRKLTSEKFLLVMDDAWHQEKEDWDKFMVNLRSRKAGSKLLVTTRDQKVAEAMKSYSIYLSCLPEVESWGLFLRSFGSSEGDMGFEFIHCGKEIVNKCGGIPLAIKTLGGILSEKREISTWRAISQSELWSEETIEGRVFTSLKLSYIHMKDNIKQCFTFCSVFPKGYGINKDRLIEQWIANGFIKQMVNEQPEVTGNVYFDLLVKVGFLQDTCESCYGNVVYKMHDLIYDLIRYILQSEVETSLPDNLIQGCTQKCRYLSLTSCCKKVERTFFDKVRALCVLEANSSFDKVVKKSRYLCSVVLECAVYTPFPLFILKLDYLRYLEIHNVMCKKLPEAISGCWNLQSLYYIHCKGFVALPKSIGKLKKLRTLELTWSDIVTLPKSIGDCQDLQSLRICSCDKFSDIPKTIGKNEKLSVFQIVDCRNLQQLPSEVIGALNSIQTINLAGCMHLKGLPSTFCPHTLHTLNLSRSRVTRLPECVTLIGNLQCVNLEECNELEKLPRRFGNLKKLEFVNLKGCSSLHWMPSGFAHLTCLKRLDLFVIGCDGNDARISDLENLNNISGELELRNLPHVIYSRDAERACLNKKKNIQNLILCWSNSVMDEEVVRNPGALDALEPPSEIERLHIAGYRGSHLPCWMNKERGPCCLETTTLHKTNQPQFHCLIELIMWKMPNLKHIRGILVFPSLKKLQLRDMANLEELWTTTSGLAIGKEEEVGEQYCFPVLSHLDIYGCPKVNVEPYFPPSLESLGLGSGNGQVLSRCKNLKQLPDPMERLTSLQDLRLIRYNSLNELPEGIGNLSSLRRLYIYYCCALQSLPYSIQHLNSLELLDICGCPELAKHYERKEGDSWNLISHIRRVYIK